MAEIKIGRIMLGMCQTNCYFVYEEGKEDVIGSDDLDSAYIRDVLILFLYMM